MKRTTLAVVIGGLMVTGAVGIYTGFAQKLTSLALRDTKGVSLIDIGTSIDKATSSGLTFLTPEQEEALEQQSFPRPWNPLEEQSSDSSPPQRGHYIDDLSQRYQRPAQDAPQEAPETQVELLPAEPVSPEAMQEALDGLMRNDQPAVNTKSTEPVSGDTSETAQEVPSAPSPRSTPAFQEAVASIGVRVGQHWRVPPREVERHGATVQVETATDGSIEKAQITRTSGHRLFNESVLKAAYAAQPFHELMSLENEARTELSSFTLTFGSVAAIEAYEGLQQQEDTVSREQEPEEPTASQTFIRNVKRQIAAAWTPPENLPLSHTLTVDVGLVIPFGSVSRAEVIRGSGIEGLDYSLVEAIRNAAPFPSIRDLPPAQQREVTSFNVHFHPNGEVN